MLSPGLVVALCFFVREDWVFVNNSVVAFVRDEWGVASFVPCWLLHRVWIVDCIGDLASRRHNQPETLCFTVLRRVGCRLVAVGQLMC